MKHTFRILYKLTLVCGLVSSALNADQTWTGQISDSLCGVNHAQMIGRRNKDLQTSSAEPDRDCTLTCIKQNAKYVFVIKSKVYKISNQDLEALKVHAGHTVRLTGDLRGDTITVSRIQMPESK
jgi:hypothetical protein